MSFAGSAVVDDARVPREHDDGPSPISSSPSTSKLTRHTRQTPAMCLPPRHLEPVRAPSGAWRCREPRARRPAARRRAGREGRATPRTGTTRRGGQRAYAHPRLPAPQPEDAVDDRGDTRRSGESTVSSRNSTLLEQDAPNDAEPAPQARPVGLDQRRQGRLRPSRRFRIQGTAVRTGCLGAARVQ